MADCLVRVVEVGTAMLELMDQRSRTSDAATARMLFGAYGKLTQSIRRSVMLIIQLDKPKVAPRAAASAAAVAAKAEADAKKAEAKKAGAKKDAVEALEKLEKLDRETPERLDRPDWNTNKPLDEAVADIFRVMNQMCRLLGTPEMAAELAALNEEAVVLAAALTVPKAPPRDRQGGAAPRYGTSLNRGGAVRGPRGVGPGLRDGPGVAPSVVPADCNSAEDY